VLVIGAHPDDAVLGAGGLVSLLTKARVPVTFLTATNGELAGDPTRRRSEELAAARVLNVDVIFGGLPDGSVARRSAIQLIEDAVNRVVPQTVLVHSPNDTNQDHVEIGRAAMSVCRTVKNVLFYEGPTTMRFSPTTGVEISTGWESKLRAMEKYASQVARARLLEWCDVVSRFRSWPHYIGSRCEAFKWRHGQLMSPQALTSSQVDASSRLFLGSRG
jgi:LmbE family N-acetylglucosaminyl deacetylase